MSKCSRLSSNVIVTMLFFAVFSLFTIANAQTLTINGETDHTGFLGDTLTVAYTFAGSDTAFKVEVWLDANGDGSVGQDDFLVFYSQAEEDYFIDGGFNDDDGTRDGSVTLIIDDFMEIAPATFIFVFTQDDGSSASALFNQLHNSSSLNISGQVTVPANTANIFVFIHPDFDDNFNGDDPNNPGGSPLGKASKSNLSDAFTKLMANTIDNNIIMQSDSNYNHCGGPNYNPEEGDKGDRLHFATLTDADGSFSIPVPDGDVPFDWVVSAFDEFGVIEGYFSAEPQFFTTDNVPSNLEIQFEAATAKITGTVKDGAGNVITDFFGNPLPLEVYAFRESGGEQHGTVENGQFSLNVIEGNFGVGIGDVPDGFLYPHEEYLQIQTGDSIHIEFVLLELDSYISGTVMIQDQGPAECVRIEAYSEMGGYADAWTDQNGFYNIPVSSQFTSWVVHVDLWSIPGDYVVDGEERYVASPGEENVNFTLVPFIPPSPHPEIIDIKDIPGDQGLQVRVKWKPSGGDYRDENGSTYGENIEAYHLWRRGPQLPPMEDNGEGNLIEYNGKTLAKVSGMGNLFALAQESEEGDQYFDEKEGWIWDYIAAVPAAKLREYAYVAPTLHDSTANGPGWSHFVVSAAPEWTGADHYFSRVDSGYSVDNLKPLFAGFFASQEENGVQISWTVENSPDVVAARVYRGDASGFALDNDHLLASIDGNSFFDEIELTEAFYVVELIDDAGNVSQSDEMHFTPTGVSELAELGVPSDFDLKQNYPNPFNPSTTIVFGLPAKNTVHIDIFDILGRKVRTLVNQDFAAGYHKVSWDGRTHFGTQVPSGIYIYQFKSGTTVLREKMTLTK